MNSSQPIFSRKAHSTVLPASTQDDAYTLAFYLLGSETQAAEVVQHALNQPFARVNRPQDLRREILREVRVQCQERQQQAFFPAQPGGDEVSNLLGHLGGFERSAAVLVDVLGLSYAEAARVLDCSPRQVGKLLARARLGLIE